MVKKKRDDNLRYKELNLIIEELNKKLAGLTKKSSSAWDRSYQWEEKAEKIDLEYDDLSEELRMIMRQREKVVTRLMRSKDWIAPEKLAIVEFGEPTGRYDAAIKAVLRDRKAKKDMLAAMSDEGVADG